MADRWSFWADCQQFLILIVTFCGWFKPKKYSVQNKHVSREISERNTDITFDTFDIFNVTVLPQQQSYWTGSKWCKWTDMSVRRPSTVLYDHTWLLFFSISFNDGGKNKLGSTFVRFVNDWVLHLKAFDTTVFVFFGTKYVLKNGTFQSKDKGRGWGGSGVRGRRGSGGRKIQAVPPLGHSKTIS